MTHCPTCTCEPKYGMSLCVYPPNVILYGLCESCGQPRWATERDSWARGSGWMSHRALHCACCTHPHDLAAGGHDFTRRQWQARAARSEAAAG